MTGRVSVACDSTDFSRKSNKNTICQKVIMLEKEKVVSERQKYDIFEKYMATILNNQKTN
jgi:hypothetical protein